MAALPYMPLFVADYLADTAHLTPAQHGAYLLLIMNYWQRGGPLPNDDSRLARIARMSKRDWAHNRDDILEFFHVQDNLLYHPRIADELSRVEAKSLKCKDAAQASVQRRFGKRSTPAEPTDTQAHTEEKPTTVVVGKKVDPRGTRLAPDWKPKPFGEKTTAMVAVWPCGMLERELSKFRDHFAKTPGARGRSLDWDASLRNWLRTADERRPRNAERSTPGSLSEAVTRILGNGGIDGGVGEGARPCRPDHHDDRTAGALVARGGGRA